MFFTNWRGLEGQARRDLCEVGRRMYQNGYVAANDGNMSVKCGSDTVLITPAGVSKGFMKPRMMVKVDLEGRVLSGGYKPSSEIKLHLAVYRENAGVTSVVHAHPPVATSFAIAGIPLDRPLVTEAMILLGVVPVAPYATPGTQDLPESILPFCRKYNAVLLANHGVLTWGRDLFEAYHRLETLEHCALMSMYSEQILNKANSLTRAQVRALIDIRRNLGIEGGGDVTDSKFNSGAAGT